VIKARDGSIIPSVSESYKKVDALTYDFKLRPNVKFHDGTTMDAEAVKKSFDRHITTGGGKSLAFVMESVEVLDPLSVRFHLKEDGPYPDFLDWAARTHYTAIVSPTAVEKLGDKDFGLHPVGSGPFKFVSWTPGNELLLEANDEYWGRRPNLDEVIIKVVPEGSVRTLQMEKGEAHLTAADPKFAKRLESDPNVMVRRGGAKSIYMMSINFHPDVNPNPALKNPLVRRAINYAINRAELIEVVEAGEAIPTVGALIPGFHQFYDETIKMFPDSGDPEKAKQLLAEAGYPDGIDMVIFTTGEKFHSLEIGQLIQKHFAKANIRVTIDNVAGAVGTQRFWSAPNEEWQAGFHDNYQVTEQASFYEIYHSDRRRDGKYPGGNLQGVTETFIDQKCSELTEAKAAGDSVRMKALVDELQKFVMENGIATSLYAALKVDAYTDQVKGYETVSWDAIYRGHLIYSHALGINVYLEE
jgi:peptide/nickel transport system substrate-binding protein